MHISNFEILCFGFKDQIFMKGDSEIISMNIISKVLMKIEWLYMYYIQNNNSSGKYK